MVKRHRFMTAEEADEQRRAAERGIGMDPASLEFLKGARLCLAMILELEGFEATRADLDRQYRDGPQVNFVLPYLQRLRALGDAEIEAGFAAALSDFISTNYQYNGVDCLERLLGEADDV